MKVLLVTTISVMVVLLSAYHVSSLSCYVGATKEAATKTNCSDVGGFDRCMSVASVYSCSTAALVKAANAEDKCVTVASVKTCGCKTDDCNDPNAAESPATTKYAMPIFTMISILLMVKCALA